MIPDSDLEIVIGCAAAHPDRRGGQHVARQCSDVLVIHKRTGIGVRNGTERSQRRNLEIARAKLQSLLDAIGDDGTE